MATDNLLTSADIDELGADALHEGDPAAVVRALVTAVEQQRLADPADTGYALRLAAEISQREGDTTGALSLIERALDAEPDNWARSRRAVLLHRLGRGAEALTELTALRPLLTRDGHAADYLAEALAECDQAALAEQWLSAAVHSLIDRPDAGDRLDRVKIVYPLLRARRELRRTLELPPDEHDELADRMARALDEGGAPASTAGALMFWPRPEFDRMLLRWPTLAEEYGQSWDEHRLGIEKAMVAAAEQSLPGLGVYAASADGLTRYAAERHGSPTDPKVRADYADMLGERATITAWPPGRNDACWCGSSAKYKKCCRPRGLQVVPGA